MRQHHPEAEIAAGNRWYVADQFAAQLGSRGRRRVIEHRWRLFREMLLAWHRRRGHTGVVTVLDAGCGDGINLVGLREIAAGEGLAMRLLGVDYSPLRLRRAVAAAPGTRVHQASLYRLPLVNESVDVVLCNHVIEHVPDVETTLSELRRVLRPGGLLIVGVPNEGCLMARVRNRVIQRSIARATDHVHFFTGRTLDRTLRDAGFDVLHEERETFFFPCSYVNACCNEFAIGHWCMAGLRRLFPSQAGGLIVASEKPGGARVANNDGMRLNASAVTEQRR
jgi:SAM-dependent methyltransferase